MTMFWFCFLVGWFVVFLTGMFLVDWVDDRTPSKAGKILSACAVAAFVIGWCSL